MQLVSSFKPDILGCFISLKWCFSFGYFKLISSIVNQAIEYNISLKGNFNGMRVVGWCDTIYGIASEGFCKA